MKRVLPILILLLLATSLALACEPVEETPTGTPTTTTPAATATRTPTPTTPETVSPTRTPTPTPSPVVTRTPTPTPTPTLTPTPSPTVTATATRSPTPTPTPGVSPPAVNTISAVKADAAPNLDGVMEDAWSRANPVTVRASGGRSFADSATTIMLRAMYTNDSVFFLAEWTDDSESNRRTPWQKQPDGSWRKLDDPDNRGGDNNLYYEDKLALLWNINDSIAGFNNQGCAVACHPGEGKPFGNKYTSNAGETGDIWHWKGVRTNPVNQIDDQYLDNTPFDAQTAPEAGRKSDPRTGGGYADNQTQDRSMPQWALPDNKPAPPYWILDDEKVAFDDSKYAAGDEVPSIIVAAFEGDRGDISGHGVWKDGKWTVEWGRKLDTGSQYDVQFSDLNKAYYFGIAAFNNAQVRHAASSGVNRLMFIR